MNIIRQSAQQVVASKEDLLAIIANNVRVVPLTASARRKLDAPYDLEQQTREIEEEAHNAPIMHSDNEARCKRFTMAGELLINTATEGRSLAKPDFVEDKWIEDSLSAAHSALDKLIPVVKEDLAAHINWLESKKAEACSEGALTRIEWEDPEAVAEAMKALAVLAQTGDNGQSA
jgi:F420-dependent methylenetetrahydromethanopterin dehydrogenase